MDESESNHSHAPQGFSPNAPPAAALPISGHGDRLRICWLGYCKAMTWAFCGHLTSTLDAVCVLLTQPCWWYRPPDVQHSATHASARAWTSWNSLPPSVRNAPSLTTLRNELKTVLAQSSFDYDYTPQYNWLRHHSDNQTGDCWRSCFYRCWQPTLEQSSTWH